MSEAAPFDVEAEAAAFVDRAAIEATEAVLADAEHRRDDMIRQALEAERRAVEARQGWAVMIDAAAAGEAPTLIEIATLHEEAEQLSRYRDFLAAVARKREEPVEAARAKLADVLHEAWWPVMKRGQDLRIAAAKRRDRARLVGPRDMSPGSVAERARLQAAVLGNAPAVFANGTALVTLAWQRGVRFKSTANWHMPGMDETSERAEREYWGHGWLEELINAAEWSAPPAPPLASSAAGRPC
jgi:hypothetical protein